MTATLDRYDADTTQHLEQRALERMLDAMCRQIDLACGKVASADAASREAALQHAAYLERRQQALSTAHSAANEPHDIRVARLERLVNALQCSRAYFCGNLEH